ncbi:protein-L-isoaspartate O-methyltransferase [Blastomonas sp.]|uniref:protein-L-isoaspartate O-methyltransferase family protein n=1 Tax=Blastomonas sp. TaxID=1909299 RepID=UPI0026291798|nr:protein-L-isoaspartate O-methyltransferase [Blastomonas sp.]MDM7956023.1 protein-L-isoaspartate O-methyltransferase [Blastomonas sp.]
MTDTHTLAPPDFAAARRHMIESQLRPSDVSDPVVIAAMAVTRREDFVPAGQQHLAYIDRSVPLGGGRVINPALSTGLLLTRAELSGNDKVLLIGAGTGYVAALLAGIVAHVVAVEDDRALVEHATTALSGMANVSVIESPLAQGHAADAPYDLIIIDGAVQQVPEAILAQLAEGGRLLAGVDENGVSRLATGRRQGGAFALIPFADTDIAPLAAFARPKSYSF